MAKNEARHHHYIPQCYLGGFATGSGKRKRVTVAALQAKNYFETNPRNIGGERDFLRIKIDGHAPNSVEKAMGDFESKVADAIRNVSETRRFEDNDRIAILNLMALMAVRSPPMRENVREYGERVSKLIMDLSLATKERWEGQMRQMREAGKGVKEEITYEQIKEFHKRGEYDIKFAREWHIGLEFKGFEAVLPYLVNRTWRLYVAEDVNGPFVTSDLPVVLTWNRPEEIPEMMRHSPGFGMSDTEVYFPITHKMAVVGVFDGPEGTVAAELPFVAMANRRMIAHAFAQVYTIRKTFPYFGPTLDLCRDGSFMERFALAQEEAKRQQGGG